MNDLDHATGPEKEELLAELEGRKQFGDTYLSGPMGTLEKPVIVKSYFDSRFVGCVGTLPCPASVVCLPHLRGSILFAAVHRGKVPALLWLLRQNSGCISHRTALTAGRWRGRCWPRPHLARAHEQEGPCVRRVRPGLQVGEDGGLSSLTCQLERAAPVTAPTAT